MGIDTARFIGKQHELFICPVCRDVVEDPVTTDPCDHLFCKSCLKTGTCPLCRTQFSRTKTIGRIAIEVYKSLVFKCAFDGCHEELKIDTYKSHERSCPHGRCPNCGCIRNEGHNCIQSLRQVVNTLRFKNGELMTELDNWKWVVNVSALILLLWFGWTHRDSWAIGKRIAESVQQQNVEEHVLEKAAKWFKGLFKNPFLVI